MSDEAPENPIESALKHLQAMRESNESAGRRHRAAVEHLDGLTANCYRSQRHVHESAAERAAANVKALDLAIFALHELTRLLAEAQREPVEFVENHVERWAREGNYRAFRQALQQGDSVISFRHGHGKQQLLAQVQADAGKIAGTRAHTLIVDDFPAGHYKLTAEAMRKELAEIEALPPVDYNATEQRIVRSMSNFERLYGAPLPPGRYEVSREDMQRIQSGGPLTFTDEETLTMLRNSGVDTDCGACVEVAFASVTLAAHTCKPKGA
jgi:hypothetical protein